jgi:hypothetical protein
MKGHPTLTSLLFGALVALNLNPVQASPSAYQQAILNDTPVAFWPLNEGNTTPPAYPNNGVVAVDIVGGKNGFYTNSDIGLQGFSTFDTNTAAGFGTDGFNSLMTSNSFVANIPTTTGATNLNFYSPSGTATNFTVEAWVYGHGTSQGNGAPFVAAGGPAGALSYSIDCGSSSDLRFFLYNVSGGETVIGDNANFNTHILAVKDPPSAWWHIVAVYNGSLNTNLMYVNGVQVAGAAPVGTQGIRSTGGAPMTFGSRQSATTTGWTIQYNGLLQNIALYNKALTAQQVANHFFARPAVPAVSFTNSFYANQGQAVTLTAYITNGSPSYNYTWYYSTTGTDSNQISSGVITTPGATPFYNGIFAATPISLTLPNPQPSQVGYTYYLYVSNAYGTSLSGSALTSVYAAPAIQSFTPVANILYTGHGQTFTVAATGELPLSYQWFTNANGGPFVSTGPSSTTATTYTTATNLPAGTYNVYVLVSNGIGITNSATNSLTLVVPTNSYPLAVLADNPVAFWPLNEGNPPATDNYPNDGLTTIDYVGGYNGYYTNADIGEPGYDPLDPNTAAQFQTSANGNSYVAGIPGTTGLNFGALSGAVNFSVEAWVSGNGNAANNTGNAIFDAGLTSFDLDIYQGVYRFYYFPPTGGSINVQGGTGVAGNVFANGWNHVVGVVDETHGFQYLYVNGAVVASQTIPVAGGLAAPAPTQPITIGARPATAGGPYTRQFNGYVQNVAVYKYALSGQQVTNHYFAAPAAPVIAMNSSFTAFAGQNGTLQATFTAGTPPISYVWYYSVNGSDSNYITSGICTNPGGTVTFTLTNAQPAQVGYTYYIYATNAYGNGTASAELSTVFAAPQVLSLTPLNAVYYTGHGAQQYTVVANGALPLSYQWYTNGVAVTGATGTNFTTPGNFPVGTYSITVLVSNNISTALSSPVTLTIMAPTQPYQLAVLGDSPLAFLPLNDGNSPVGDSYPNDGVVALDYVGGYDGCYTNADIGEPGDSILGPDTAAAFGLLTNENSFVGGITGINFGANTNQTSSFSVEAWLSGYGQGAGAGIVASESYGNGGEQFGIDTGSPNNALRFFFRDGTGHAHNVTSTNVPTSAAWYHVVGVVDDVLDMQYLYVNGVLVNSLAFAPNLGVLSNTSPITIGARMAGLPPNENYQFEGSIQYVSIYNYALSSQQVGNHYQSGQQNPPANYMATNFDAFAGQNVTLTANIVGAPSLGYVWSYSVTGTDSNYITSGITTSGDSTVTLTLTNVPLAHSGYIYSLYTTNAYGVATSSAVLQVASGTGPTLSATLSGSQITLGWPTATSPLFNLQTATNLLGPWVTVTNGITVVGTTNSYTGPTTNAAQFYRMQAP